MIHGEFQSLSPDLLEDEAKFFVYFLMTYGKFMILLDMLGPNFSREDTCYREAVGPKERLARCLSNAFICNKVVQKYKLTVKNINLN
jgi:hypothetical protein